MKKFYALAFVAALTAPAMWAQTGERPGEVTNFTMTFDFNNGNPIISGSFDAPTHTQSYSDPQPLEALSKIEVTRSCYSVGEYDIPVYTISNPTPGQHIEFTEEEELEYGYNYTYSVMAYSTENMSSYSSTQSLFIGIKPAAPTVEISTGENGNAPVTLTITAPSTTADNASLPTPLTKLEIKQYIGYNNEPVLETIQNPEPGKSYTFVHNAENGKSYTYNVYASTAFGTSEYSSKSLFVGPDVPAAPASVTAVLDENGSVKISWTAPEGGKNKGYIDPAETRYNVKRSSSKGEQTIASNIAECEVVDNLEDITAPSMLTYTVTAINSQGEGGYSSSSSILAGPAASLPFSEDFNAGGQWSVEPENIWSKDPDGWSSNWDFSNYDYSTSITGADGDEDGYAYASYRYSSEGTHDRLISTQIDFTEAQYPVMTFYTNSAANNPNKLEVEVRGSMGDTKAGEFTPAEYQTGDETAWTRHILPLEAAKGEKANIIFHSYTEGDESSYDNIFIDKIKIDDYPPVQKVTAEGTGSQATLTWDVPSNSSAAADKFEVVINDGDPIEVNSPEYNFAITSGTKYKAAVRAIYGDVPSALSAPVMFTADTLTSINSIEAGKAVNVEYFNVNGIKVSEPVKGTTLIRRSTMADGSIRHDKVVVR